MELLNNQMIYHRKLSTCLSPPSALPPLKSMVTKDVIAPPPMSPLPPAFLIAFRIEFSMLPYVVPCPRSIAWIKQKVMAPVDVIFDRACLRSSSASSYFFCKMNSKEMKWIVDYGTYRCISRGFVIITATERNSFSTTSSFPYSRSGAVVLPHVLSTPTTKGKIEKLTVESKRHQQLKVKQLKYHFGLGTVEFVQF